MARLHVIILTKTSTLASDFFWPLLQLTCRFYSSDGGTDEVYATSCKLLVLIRAIGRQAEEEGEGGGKGMIGVMVVVVVH